MHYTGRVFKNKPFSRFARKCGITDSQLCATVIHIRRGLIDAELGGGIIKQRLGRKGEGKSGGFRVLIVYRSSGLTVFVHGFAKNDLGNIDEDELVALKKLATKLLAYGASEVDAAVKSGVLIEVICNGEHQAIS